MVHHKSPGDGRKYAIGRDLIEEGIMTNTAINLSSRLSSCYWKRPD